MLCRVEPKPLSFAPGFAITSADLEETYITKAHFDLARKKVQPSAQREGFSTCPNVSWDSIGALKDLKEELHLSVIAPIQNPDLFKSFNLDAPSGILLYGPPGCGKTLLAKAIASASHANFISVKGPELLNKYVGESERAVRSVFQRAGASAPCIVFFDELDALAPKREGGASGGNSGAERVVNQLLTELDGVGNVNRSDIFVIGASNRPDIIDPALLRPGRLGKLINVPMPCVDSRYEILKSILKPGKKVDPAEGKRVTPLAEDVDLKQIAELLEGWSGADLKAICQESTVIALKEWMSEMGGQEAVLTRKPGSETDKSAPNKEVAQRHFLQACKKLRPSVSAAERKRYAEMAEKIQAEGLGR